MIKVTTGHANADIEGTQRYSSNTFAIWALEGGGRSTPIHGKDPVPILRATGWVVHLMNSHSTHELRSQ
jgi:hypothetical protein